MSQKLILWKLRKTLFLNFFPCKGQLFKKLFDAYKASVVPYRVPIIFFCGKKYWCNFLVKNLFLWMTRKSVFWWWRKDLCKPILKFSSTLLGTYVGPKAAIIYFSYLFFFSGKIEQKAILWKSKFCTICIITLSSMKENYFQYYSNITCI